MSRKFEDKLIRLAFGDSSLRESSSLERKVQSDPEAARALEEYQSLKIGLNLLTDVPPDQLSKERLRDAILGQGLKPLPVEPAPRWGWAWMPVTAAALAFAWIGVRHMNANGPAAGPRFVAPAETVAKNGTPAPALRAPSFAPTMTVARKSTPVATPQADFSERLASKPQVADHDAKPLLAVDNLTTKSKPIQVIIKAPAKAPQQSAAEQSDSAGKLVSNIGPLVVINPESDNNSGAQKATEVDGASDVGPVGG